MLIYQNALFCGEGENAGLGVLFWYSNQMEVVNIPSYLPVNELRNVNRFSLFKSGMFLIF